MKPPRFEYRAPSDVEEVVGILTEVGDEGKVLAGGQSLVPSMNFRLARPGLLVDINGVKALDYIQRSGDRILIGTLTRHSCLENAAAVPGPWEGCSRRQRITSGTCPSACEARSAEVWLTPIPQQSGAWYRCS